MRTIFDADVSNSTLKDVISEGQNKKRRMMSMVTLAFVACLIVAALCGLFDRESTKTHGISGQRVEVDYQSIARAGNEVELEIRVSSEKPLSKELTVQLSEEYLKFFEDLAVFPDPDSQTANGDGALSFTISVPNDATKTVVRVTGRASDQWDIYTPGTLQVQSGSAKHNISIATWRIP
ncbi:hypothetical protein AUR04nite_05590 [Glutamicibacter uratoxydans]|uniref:Uncharacterized protein n=1 Tax=Glutamicibacter uratoxydans TaxID=43667 RepID=A0A4Y4DK77_GLUUR|nr:hypothetical protein [Glutamicibacter uratoxydans]GED05027.1 hypothetical protein AUR04nite_05590 [Glutamicibacter uratoxydans]